MIKSLLDISERCAQGVDLGREEIPLVASALLSLEEPQESKEAFLEALARKGETPQELAGLAQAFLPQARPAGLEGSWEGKPLFDCCGTGGGGLSIVNLSTGIVFILAALGVPVVKHGNRGVTKKSGSADVWEALGLKGSLDADALRQSLEKAGYAFLPAPHWHPGFAAVAAARKALAARGVRTVFNLLGPLLNPACPQARLVGVFQKEHGPLLEQALGLLGSARHAVVYGTDDQGQPIGEASVSGKNEIWPQESSLASIARRLDAPAFVPAWSLADWSLLAVNDAHESAGRLIAVLEGKERGLARALILENAALGLCVAQGTADFSEAHARCIEALDSGKALAALRAGQNMV